jgi:CDP-glucose 4,6-dehydratase
MENLEMTFWKNQKVFVTGASGLLGSSLVERLLAEGASVTCLVRDWVHGSKLLESDYLARCNIVHGDLIDHDVLLRAVNEYEIDSVFHLGAQTIVGTASRSPLSTFESNIRGTWNLLEACRQCPGLIERVVVASSDKAYGSHEKLPYTESTPLVGRFPYDVSKSCTDLISMSYFHTYQLPVAITRCGNLFGPGDLNFNRLIPGTIKSVLENEAPIIRSDGKFVRDYFYVTDAVDAYLRLAERLPDEEFNGQDFNFGTETPVSVLDLVNRILKLMDRSDLEPRILNQGSLEISKQYLDCSKAKERLDWQPTHSFDEGLVETIDWYENVLETRGEQKDIAG